MALTNFASHHWKPHKRKKGKLHWIRIFALEQIFDLPSKQSLTSQIVMENFFIQCLKSSSWKQKNKSSSNFRVTSTNNVWVSPLASQHHVLFIQLRSKKNESLVASHSVLLLWNYLWVDTLIFLFILWVNYFSSKGWRKEERWGRV